MKVKILVKKRKILSLIFIFSSVFYLTSCTVVGGPVSPKIKTKINQTITETFKESGFTGKITHVSARHNGFAPGGISASYTYSENVGGKKVKLDGYWDFDDEGDDYSSEADSVTGIVSQIVLKNPEYVEFTKKYSTMVYHEFQKLDTSTLKVSRNSGAEELGFGQYVSEENGWLTKYAENNKKREFNGYYSIPAEELFRNNAIYFSLPFHYNYSPETFRKDSKVKQEKITQAAQEEIIKELKTVDFSDFPEGTYNIGWNIQKPDSSDDDFVMYGGNQISFTVKNGKNTSIGEWQ